MGKFPHFIGWNGGGALEQVALNVNQSSLSPNSMDCSNLFDLVQIEVHPKLVEIFTWLIPSSFLKKGSLSLCTKKFLRQIWPV